MIYFVSFGQAIHISCGNGYYYGKYIPLKLAFLETSTRTHFVRSLDTLRVCWPARWQPNRPASPRQRSSCSEEREPTFPTARPGLPHTAFTLRLPISNTMLPARTSRIDPGRNALGKAVARW